MRKQNEFRGAGKSPNKLWGAMVTILALGIAVSGTHAQEATVLKLDRAITLALHNDTDVQVAGNDVAKAKLAVGLEQINNLPSATTRGQYEDSLDNRGSSQNYQVKVQQTIPTKWHLYGHDEASNVETKRWEQATSEEAYRIRRAETVNNTVSLYFNALKAQKTWQYQQRAVEYAEENAVFQARQLELGKITKTTQLSAANDLAKAKYELEKDKQAWQLALKKLAQQVGVGAYQTLVLDDALPGQKPAAVDYEKLKTPAINGRPEVQQAQITVKTARQELAVAQNSGLPSLSLDYQDRGELQSYNAKFDLLSGDFSWSTAWQKTQSDDNTLKNFNSQDLFGSVNRKYGVTLSWTLDFGSAANQAKQASLAVESAQRKLEQASRDVELEMDEAAADYESALAGLGYNQAGIALYEKTLETKKLQYKVGVATAIDLKKAELDLEGARKDETLAVCDLWIAAQKLKLALGLLYEVQ